MKTEEYINEFKSACDKAFSSFLFSSNSTDKSERVKAHSQYLTEFIARASKELTDEINRIREEADEQGDIDVESLTKELKNQFTSAHNAFILSEKDDQT